MKITESEVFIEMSKSLVDYYDWWDKTADIQKTQGSGRRMVGGTNSQKTTCCLIFKGNGEDLEAVKKLLQERDQK